MSDVLTPEQRRLNMSRIRGLDTLPELLVRKGLHARGLRYRLQDRSLPGRPDLVFPKHKVVIFVHGCFWHAHGCNLCKVPRTREQFWTEKLSKNRMRDQRVTEDLNESGWCVLVIWECALRGAGRHDRDQLFDMAETFIRSGTSLYCEITNSRPLQVSSLPEQFSNPI